MTISRVFHGSSLVSDRTRRKVLEAAKAVGYQPNLAARALRTGRATAVGFLMESYLSLRGEFHTECFSAFESVISAHGLGVMISIASPKQRLCQRAQHLLATSSCGALVIRFDSLSREDLEELADIGAPVVLANYNPNIQPAELNLSCVGFDNRQGTQLAVRHLVSLGHRRIAFLGGTPGWIDSVRREEGFRLAMKEVGLPVEEQWVRACDFGKGFESGTEGMAQVFARGLPGPTAVVCVSDEIAAGAMASAKQWGKSIAGDFSVVGFDDNRWSTFVTPPLTTIRHSGWELGEQLGKMLLELMHDSSMTPRRKLLETRLVVRESTGPVPAK